jgi:hypothetical protein
MLLISTVTNFGVCPLTMPCFPPYLRWLMTFILLPIGKLVLVGLLTGVSVGMSVGGVIVSIMSVVVVTVLVMLIVVGAAVVQYSIVKLPSVVVYLVQVRLLRTLLYVLIP